MKMNKHYNELKASYLFVDIAHKVAAYQEAHPEKEIIRLGIGDVTQPLAKCVVDAMHDAVTEMGTKEGFHGYGPEQGYPFLKQAIQGYYAGRGTKLDELPAEKPSKTLKCCFPGLHHFCQSPFPCKRDHCRRTGCKRTKSKDPPEPFGRDQPPVRACWAEFLLCKPVSP